MALKDAEVRALKAVDRVYKRADERGLYVEVHPSGSKLWRLKYNHLGKEKRIALGRYPEVVLAEARRKRDEARQQVRDGIDPLAERKREKPVAQLNGANTFGDIAKECIDKMVGKAAPTPPQPRRIGCWSSCGRSPLRSKGWFARNFNQTHWIG